MMDNPQFSLTNPLVGIPKLTKTVAAGLGVLLLFGISSTLTSVFALNIGYFVPYVWNIITSGFFEIYLITGIVNIILLLFAGKYLEPIWGSKEFLQFIVAVNLGAGLGAFILTFIVYVIVRDEYMLYSTNLCGFSGVIAGFTVALKQLIPEQEMRLFLGITMRTKQMPGVIVLSSIALFVLHLYPSHHLPHTLFGVLSAWLYLRFYQRKGEVVGDLSDSFAFATFFPEPAQPFINILATILYVSIFIKFARSFFDKRRN